uniref:pectinesterase n=1 Tax=Cunninghamia lanceolata TaxID=28977 RepID=A0A6G9W381_CUNLA|nr:pectin methylesterase 30 [Cunninghamia lanceolata]
MAEGELTQRVLRVAENGGAHYSDVQTAIDAVALHNKQRVVIEIMPGVYKQPLYIPKTKNFITLRGFRREDTILTWDNTATRINHHQDESVIGSGTFACGSVIVEGSDFIAEEITFENSAPQGSGQAVAIRVTADRCAFYNCRFLGWQDTAYLNHGRQYLRDCYIEGSVDFICGNATALLEHCHIHCKASGWITAQSRRSEDDSSGYVFLRCVITGNGERSYAYLGRPWESFARVLFAYTWMDGSITPLGWHNWDSPEKEETACFYEYRCFGPGSDCSQRVKWLKILEDDKIDQYAGLSFIDPNPHKTWLTWFTNGL